MCILGSIQPNSIFISGLLRSAEHRIAGHLMHHVISLQTGNALLTSFVQPHIQKLFNFLFDSIYESGNALQSAVALGIDDFVQFPQSHQFFSCWINRKAQWLYILAPIRVTKTTTFFSSVILLAIIHYSSPLLSYQRSPISPHSETFVALLIFFSLH